MAGSDNNDVINNQNQVVEALQGEHNKLERREADVNRLSKYIDDLEKQLLIINDIDTAFIKILSIKSQCDEVASHISIIEIAFNNLLKGKLSPNLVNTDSVAQTLNTLRDKLIKKGYTLGLNEIIDIIQSDCSFVSYEGETMLILLYIPVYKCQTKLLAYEYLDIPLTTTDNNTAVKYFHQNRLLILTFKMNYSSS